VCDAAHLPVVPDDLAISCARAKTDILDPRPALDYPRLGHFLAEMLRARCALGLHSVSPDPSLLGVAERFVRWSTRSSAALVQGWGLLIDAAMNVSAGQRERAVAKLQLAEQRLDEAGALQVVAVSLRRRGELIGGTEGSRLVHLADQQFLDLGVTNPARMTARFLPGRFSSSP